MILSREEKLAERLTPRLWQQGFLSMYPLLKNLNDFSLLIKDKQVESVLDLGCGVKPYAKLFTFIPKYIGFDVEENESVDVIGFNWDLPFKDDEFDALISTQVLEHTAKITETVKEIRRVVKGEGLIYISVPLTFPEHGIPYDFYRFTRFGLMEVFRDFEIISITPHNGYLGTLFRLWNNFLFYIPGNRYFLWPVFMLNNIFALGLDWFAEKMSHFPHPIFKEAYDKLYMGMTESYSMVLGNKK